MERSSGGILLIDEIENGLHYSVQPDLWQVIFETAQELDVQVFATTHSYDCVQAFQQVAQDYERSESMLVSLRRREEDPEDIVAVLSDRDELGTVVEENIEVR
jgi:AAA15 family ATPase/GTPase